MILYRAIMGATVLRLEEGADVGSSLDSQVGCSFAATTITTGILLCMATVTHILIKLFS